MAAASIVSLVALTACSTNSSGATADGGVSLDLVAYSTPETACDEITADFAETPEGDGVEFSTSYGPSGDQSRAVDAVDGDEVSVVVTRTAARNLALDEGATVWLTPANGATVIPSMRPALAG